jgi:hypothetical protein
VHSWSLQSGDEVRVIDGDHAGSYATVIECEGIEALVEFPDRRQAVFRIEALALVLRPAPGTSNAMRAAQIIREAFDP